MIQKRSKLVFYAAECVVYEYAVVASFFFPVCYYGVFARPAWTHVQYALSVRVKGRQPDLSAEIGCTSYWSVAYLLTTELHGTMIAFAIRKGVSMRAIAPYRVSFPQALAGLRRSYVTPSRPFNANQSAIPSEIERDGPLSNDQLLERVFDQKELVRSANRPIYMDAQSTTPVDPRVLDAMMPYYVEQYGNPHSRTHAYGWETESATHEARNHVAELIGADAKEIIFTSGATESNNMILKGVANFYRAKKNHIITTQTEHKCVLDSCRSLQEQGFEVTYLPVQPNGQINLDTLRKELRPTTSIVSIMSVNNETGVIQPIKEIGEILKTEGHELCKQLGKGVPKPFFHTDAAQAVGKIPIDVNEAGIDLMSISGHKIYGPMGIGAAFVRRRPRVRLEPLMSGGGQERGLRSGTLATPLVVGFGEAARIAKKEMAVRIFMGAGWRQR